VGDVNVDDNDVVNHTGIVSAEECKAGMDEHKRDEYKQDDV
jgi:hypothetical protein